MKTILITTLTMLCGIANAQITITQSDMPVVGDVFVIANDTTCTTPVGNAGAGETWNLLTLQNQRLDTIYFVEPASTPAPSLFPSSNLVYKIFNKNTGFYSYSYLKITFDLLELQGSYSGSLQGPTVITYNPPIKNLEFPQTYNSTFTDTSDMLMTLPFASPPFDSLKIKGRINRTSIVDGWGTVTTPANTYSNSLRFRKTDNKLDSTFFHNSTSGIWSFITSSTKIDTSYQWITKEVHFQISDIMHNPAGVSPPITGDYLLSIPTGVQKVDFVQQINLHPNPWSTQTILQSGNYLQNGTLTIYNSFGQQVKQIKNISGRTVVLSRDNLASGLYYIRLTQDNKIFTTDKIIITD